MKRSQVGLGGSGWANYRGAWVRDIRAMDWDWYSHCTSPITGKCNMVTCMEPKEAKSSWAPRGLLMGQSACSSGVESNSSAHKREKLGSASRLHLGTGASSSGGVWPLLALIQLAH